VLALAVLALAVPLRSNPIRPGLPSARLAPDDQERLAPVEVAVGPKVKKVLRWTRQSRTLAAGSQRQSWQQTRRAGGDQAQAARAVPARGRAPGRAVGQRRPAYPARSEAIQADISLHRGIADDHLAALLEHQRNAVVISRRARRRGRGHNREVGDRLVAALPDVIAHAECE
jgi:hypothetical protein